MSVWLLLLISVCHAVTTPDNFEYRRLRVIERPGDSATLPPLYQNRSSSFAFLDVYLATGSRQGEAFLNARYKVMHPSGRSLWVSTDFRKIELSSSEQYNSGLLRYVKSRMYADAIANVPVRDLREPLFADGAVLLSVEGVATGFSQEITIAMPESAFTPDSNHFPAQVRLRHHQLTEDPAVEMEALRFFSAVVVADALTEDQDQTMRRLIQLNNECQGQLGN